MPRPQPTPKLMAVPAVPRGAKVAVLSPASYPQPERLARGVEALRSLGYEPTTGKHALAKANQYFAGTPSQRLADLHAAYLDTSTRAIFCSRGGYGSNYLLQQLDLELIAANPKPLIGYSDLTAIQTWLIDQLGMPAFHGPMVAADFSLDDGVDRDSLTAALTGQLWAVGEESGLRSLKPGRATGVLQGGCLSLLAASLGTAYAPRFAARTEGTLLFLEDLAVKPYQLDRLLRQLILAGRFEGVTGVVFGEMLDCGIPGQTPMPEEIILRVLDWFDGPIAVGLRSGHVSRRNVTLTFGVQAELNLLQRPSLTFLERGTQL